MNNFNMSSTGINIETNIGYDEIMGQINFDENINRVDVNGVEYFVYSDYGNIDTDISIDDLIKYDLESNTLLNDLKVYHNKEDIKKEDYQEYFDMLEDDLSYMDLEEIQEVLYDMSVPYTTHYKIVNITGYSQGDYASVIILTDKLKEVWGVAKLNIVDVKQNITNYFYDTPLRAVVTVNNEDYFIEGYDGYYQFDYSKEEVIKALIHDTPNTINKTILRAELEKVIPTEPKYL